MRVSLILSGSGSYAVGADVGGTFTDSVVVDSSGNIVFGKALSVPHDFASGILDSVTDAARKLDLSLEELLNRTRYFAHGTTIVTNTIVNRSGANAGLICTKGFEDTLLMMRGIGRVAGLDEEDVLHVARTNKPSPIIVRRSIEGVPERVDSQGNIVIALNREKVVETLQKLVGDRGIDSLGICLLWSFRNPAHEKMIAESASRMFPNLFVTISSELAPMIGEYERMSTVALNAYVGPVTSRYLEQLRDVLRRHGLKTEPMIIQSNGGALPASKAAARSIGTIESGPVAGVVASSILSNTLGIKNVIATDMGGTTFKASIVRSGEAERSRESTFFQYALLSPALEIASIGAGGGTIAFLDKEANLIKVGPKSAGAAPGPICYGLGGTEVTITDADAIVGYLDPDYFLGGRLKLDKGLALKRLSETIAKPLGLEPMDAAIGIIKIANAQMSDLLRRVTVERGHDPREFVLFAYGGASPVHACAYAKDLGVSRIIVPFSASVHCALGAVMSDIVHEYALSDPMRVPAKVERVNKNFESLEKKALEDVRSEGLDEKRIILERKLDMKYARQVHSLSTLVPIGAISEGDMDRVYDDFVRMYELTYGSGSTLSSSALEVTTFRLRLTAPVDKPQINPRLNAVGKKAMKPRRMVVFPEEGEIEASIYDLEGMLEGEAIDGPAIIETPITTIVVPPNDRAEIDKFHNVVINLGR